MKITKASDIKRLGDNGSATVEGIRGLLVLVKNKNLRYIYRRTVRGQKFEFPIKAKDFTEAKFKALKWASMDSDEFIDKIRSNSVEDKKLYVFEDVANAYITWRVEVGDWEATGKARQSALCRLNRHALPIIQKMYLSEITPSVVAKIAVRSKDTPEACDRTLDLVRIVFDWAKAKGWYTGDNPADKRGALQFLLPKSKPQTRNLGALPLNRVSEFCRELYRLAGTRELLFLFSVLTATRSATARSVRWEHIDLKKRVWHVKQDTLKVKSNGLLDIPLSDAAMRVLSMMKHQKEGLVFKSPYNQSMYSDAVFCQLIPYMNTRTDEPWIDEAQTRKTGKTIVATQHGIARACFRTWSQDDSLGNDKRFSANVAELCLHHNVHDAYNGAYERGEYYKRRVEMMQAWGEFCLPKA